MANSANLTYYQRHKEKLLIKVREYYKNNGDKIKEKRDNLPEEKKNKIKEYQRQWRNNKSEDAIIKGREYAKNRYRNLPDEEKNKRREYSKRRYQMLIMAR